MLIFVIIFRPCTTLQLSNFHEVSTFLTSFYTNVSAVKLNLLPSLLDLTLFDHFFKLLRLSEHFHEKLRYLSKLR